MTQNPRLPIISFFLLLSVSFYAQIPTNGLIGAWAFNGNANDASGTNNHGLVTGAVLVPDRCGNPNSAYRFNGSSDYIDMSKPGPTGSSARSFSFWAKTKNISLMTSFGYGGAGQGSAFAVQYNYNCLGIGADVNTQAFTKGATCLVDDKWHHIVCILDPQVGVTLGDLIFYIDGTLYQNVGCVISGTTDVINTNTAFPICIGKVQDDMARYFEGDMDDFYFYNRVITYNEVMQLYTACAPAISGKTVVCTGEAANYSINNNSFGNAYTWTVPSGWSGASSTTTLGAVSGANSGTISISLSSGCGLPVTSKLNVTVSKCVGTEDSYSMQQLMVFPNPAQANVQVTLPVAGQLFLLDANGKVVATQSLNEGDNHVDLSSFADGFYTARVNTSHGAFHAKIIVNH